VAAVRPRNLGHPLRAPVAAGLDRGRSRILDASVGVESMLDRVDARADLADSDLNALEATVDAAAEVAERGAGDGNRTCVLSWGQKS
jgi:hypothetical protein